MSFTGKLILCSALVAFSLINVSPAAAEIHDDAGTTSLNFLKVGVGARAAAMGGAFNAISDDASAVFWNPAGLAETEGMEAFFMHNHSFEDIGQSSASLIFGIDQFRFGASFSYFSMGELERRSGNTPLPDGTFTPFDMAIGLSAAYQVTELISAGVTGRFVHEDIDTESARAVLFDIGAKARTAIPGLVASFTIRNVGTELKYQNEGYSAPRTVNLGASYSSMLPWEGQAIVTSAEIVVPNDNDTRIAVGAEYGYRDFLFGRLGYTSGLDYGDMTYGFGVRYLGLRVDYAFVPYSDLGDSHRFSLNYIF